MDIIDIALAKNFAKKMAAGFTNVEVDGMDIIFTLIDGQTVTLTVPAPADGVSVTDVDIDINGDLICTMSDGSEINAGKALPQKGVDYFTEEEIEDFKEDISEDLQNEIDLLKSNFDNKTTTVPTGALINDAINDNIVYTPIGKTSQNTTSIAGGDEYDSPSPEHEQTINNVNGDVHILFCQKNLFDKTTTPSYKSSVSVTVTDEGLRITDGASSSGNHYADIPIMWGIENLVGRKLRVKATWTNSASNKGRLIFRVNGNSVGQQATSGNTLTYTVSDELPNNSKFSLSLYSNYGGTVAKNDYVDYSNIIVTLDDTDMEYEPYKGKAILFPLEEGQALMQNSYLADDGIHHKKRRKIFTGTETISYDSQYKKYNMNIAQDAVKQTTHGVFSNYCTTDGSFRIVTGNSTAYLWLWDINSIFEESVTTLKTWLAEKYTGENPFIAEYPCNNEWIESYTEEQQLAWNQIKQLQSYKNKLQIFSSSNNLAPDNKITYLINPLTDIDNRLKALEEA